MPIELIGQRVDVRVDAERVRIFKGQLVADHARRYGKHQYALEIEHYLPLLERKLRAVPRAFVVHDWLARQSRSWRVLLDVLQRQRGQYQGADDFVATIRLSREHGAERVTNAVERALRQNEVSLATIRYFLGMALEEERIRPAPMQSRGPRVAVGSITDYGSMLELRHG